MQNRQAGLWTGASPESIGKNPPFSEGLWLPIQVDAYSMLVNDLPARPPCPERPPSSMKPTLVALTAVLPQAGDTAALRADS
jgi:hypothetical protein